MITPGIRQDWGLYSGDIGEVSAILYQPAGRRRGPYRPAALPDFGNISALSSSRANRTSRRSPRWSVSSIAGADDPA